MSRYVGDNFNGVLFLLREPNSNGKPVSENDNAWITKVLHSEQTKNADKYRKTFYSLLNSLGFDNACLPNTAFDNIKPDGGESSISNEYKACSLSERAIRAFSIIDEINPKYVFACLDIYEAIKRYLIYNKIYYRESNDGLVYKKAKKSKIELTYNNVEIQIFQIYHPCLGWNILQ